MALKNVALVSKVDLAVDSYTIKEKHPYYQIPLTRDDDNKGEATYILYGDNGVFYLEVTTDIGCFEPYNIGDDNYVGIGGEKFGMVAKFHSFVDVNGGNNKVTLKFIASTLYYGNLRSRALNEPAEGLRFIPLSAMQTNYTSNINIDFSQKVFKIDNKLYILDKTVKLWNRDNEFEKGSVVYTTDSTGKVAFYEVDKHIVFPYGKYVKVPFDTTTGTIRYTTATTDYVYKIGDSSVTVEVTSGGNSFNHEGRLIPHTKGSRLRLLTNIYDVIVHEGDYYIDSGVVGTNLIDNISDENFTRLDDFFGWNFVGYSNEGRAIDEALNTYTEFEEGGEVVYKVTSSCSFDFIALRKYRGSDINIEVLDATNNVVETFTIPSSITPVTYHERDFYQCCLEGTECHAQVLKDKTYNLSTVYDNTHKIRISATGHAIVGGLFVGLNEEIPCIKTDLTVRVRNPKEGKINPISQIKEVESFNGLRFRDTEFTIHLKSVEESAVWLDKIAAYTDSLTYFNTKFEYEDWNDQTQYTDRYEFLSHGGFLETVEMNGFKQIKCKIREYNNA
jgi:hypothetical protein